VPTLPGNGSLVAPAASPLQAIYVEPANPPFNIEITEAGQPAYQGIVSTTYGALGDDVTQVHTLTVVPTITFGGVAYTQVLVGSNGMITFSTGSTQWVPTPAEFHAGFRPAASAGSNPGVAPVWGDWAQPAAAGDSVRVVEYSQTGIVSVEYNNQVWYSSSLPAGSWSCDFGTFGANSFVLNLGGFLAGNATDSLPMVGVTDGSDTNGPNNTFTGFQAMLPYASASAPDSLCEQFPAGGAGLSALGTVSFLDPAGTMQWTIF